MIEWKRTLHSTKTSTEVSVMTQMATSEFITIELLLSPSSLPSPLTGQTRITTFHIGCQRLRNLNGGRGDLEVSPKWYSDLAFLFLVNSSRMML
jgi:hypothetical protein